MNIFAANPLSSDYSSVAIFSYSPTSLGLTSTDVGSPNVDQSTDALFYITV
jgi:hypothetical protein